MSESRMKLEAVFWDYPRFLNEEYIRAFVRNNADPEMILWLMTRFLEHGRAVDALSLFGINDIATHLPSLKLSDAAAKKWRRLVEVYASH
jgi:hypothetical protein